MALARRLPGRPCSIMFPLRVLIMVRLESGGVGVWAALFTMATSVTLGLGADKAPEVKGLKLTVSAAQTEVLLAPTHPPEGIISYSLNQLGLRFTFSNESDRPIKLDTVALAYKLKLDLIGPDGQDHGYIQEQL